MTILHYDIEANDCHTSIIELVDKDANREADRNTSRERNKKKVLKVLRNFRQMLLMTIRFTST